MKKTELLRDSPKAIESEQVVLGSMLLEPDEAVPKVDGLLSEDDFYRRAHRKIFKAIKQQFYKGGEADIVGIAHHLEDIDEMGAAGGRIYLNELLDKVTTTASVEYYAKIIRNAAWRRRLIATGYEMVELGYTTNGDPGISRDKALKIVSDAVLKDGPGDDVKKLSELRAGFLERFRAVREHKDTVLTTGFSSLDKRIRDLSSKLTLIAGFTSMGKSMMMLNMAYRQMLKGIPVGIVSLEMAADEVTFRLMMNRGGLTEDKLYFLPVKDLQQLVDEIHALPCTICSMGSGSLYTILREIRQMVYRDGVKCVYVDYIQLIGDDSRMNRTDELEKIARHLLLFAKKEKIGIVAGCQISRDIVQRDNYKKGQKVGRPKLWMLRSSGGLENSADIVLGLHLPGFTDINEEDGTIEVWILKQRSGRRNIYEKLACDCSLQRVGDLAGVPAQAEKMVKAEQQSML